MVCFLTFSPTPKREEEEELYICIPSISFIVFNSKQIVNAIILYPSDNPTRIWYCHLQYSIIHHHLHMTYQNLKQKYDTAKKPVRNKTLIHTYLSWISNCTPWDDMIKVLFSVSCYWIGDPRTWFAQWKCLSVFSGAMMENGSEGRIMTTGQAKKKKSLSNPWRYDFRGLLQLGYLMENVDTWRVYLPFYLLSMRLYLPIINEELNHSISHLFSFSCLLTLSSLLVW